MSKTKYITFSAMGIALYVAMSYAIRVPVFENYYICLGYVALLAYCYIFGPAMGCIVGTAGCVLYCLLTSGLRGMPGWTLGNLVLALMLGLVFKATARLGGSPLRIVIELATITAATFTGILIVKSFTEMLLYAQPMLVRMAKNAYAFVSDLVVLVIAMPICRALLPVAKRTFAGEARDAVSAGVKARS